MIIHICTMLSKCFDDDISAVDIKTIMFQQYRCFTYFQSFVEAEIEEQIHDLHCSETRTMIGQFQSRDQLLHPNWLKTYV